MSRRGILGAPTMVSSSQGNEQRIYEYVVRHFLACCSQNAEGHETSVEIEVAGEGFSAQGLAITARNYLDVFPYDKWSDKVCMYVVVIGHFV